MLAPLHHCLFAFSDISIDLHSCSKDDAQLGSASKAPFKLQWQVAVLDMDGSVLAVSQVAVW